MFILSFDCGITNFAYSVIEFLSNKKNLVFNNKEIILKFFDNNNYKIIDINNINLYKINNNNNKDSEFVNEESAPIPTHLNSAGGQPNVKHTSSSCDTSFDLSNNKKSKKKSNFPNLHKSVISLLYNLINNKNIIEKITTDDKNCDIKILIEYQMNINYKANIIYNIIISFFETYFKINNFNNFEIITINPSYKIKIAQNIDNDNKIRIKYINQYTYNKKLVEIYFLNINKKYKFIDLTKFKKYDDIADSFIQILSYIYYY
tara:strand:+ start:1238 stop:2020 length:783 start_codon:yes stop_codon:yes gene_type:complete